MHFGQLSTVARPMISAEGLPVMISLRFFRLLQALHLNKPPPDEFPSVAVRAHNPAN
jgi:hypothetical protein